MHESGASRLTGSSETTLGLEKDKQLAERMAVERRTGEDRTAVNLLRKV